MYTYIYIYIYIYIYTYIDVCKGFYTHTHTHKTHLARRRVQGFRRVFDRWCSIFIRRFVFL